MILDLVKFIVLLASEHTDATSVFVHFIDEVIHHLVLLLVIRFKAPFEGFLDNFNDGAVICTGSKITEVELLGALSH